MGGLIFYLGLGAVLFAALALLGLLFCAWVCSLGDFWD
jgi:hypothetical protein